MLLLKMERLKRGLSISNLSYKVKIHPATIGKIEAQKMIAYKPHREKLSAFFGLPADDLFQEVDNENQLCKKEVIK